MEFRGDVNQTESIKSLIWILGNFAQFIDEAPYVIEEYIEN